MTDDNPVDVYEVIRDELGLLPSQALDAPFLLTASVLLDRQIMRRRKAIYPPIRKPPACW